jgi:hypothetical protein
MTQRATRDERLYNDMAILKRHLGECRQCRAATKGFTPYNMCPAGMLMTVAVASRFDSIIRLRRAAHNGPDHTVFACPDLSRHGKAYALAALPLHVTSTQDRLF